MFHPEADSGFDGSYSGGSSGGGFSSSSSWSGGSSYGGSYYYSSGSADPISALITLAIFLVVIALVLISAKKKITGQMPTTSITKVPPYELEELKQILNLGYYVKLLIVKQVH